MDNPITPETLFDVAMDATRKEFEDQNRRDDILIHIKKVNLAEFLNSKLGLNVKVQDIKQSGFSVYYEIKIPQLQNSLIFIIDKSVLLNDNVLYVGTLDRVIRDGNLQAYKTTMDIVSSMSSLGTTIQKFKEEEEKNSLNWIEKLHSFFWRFWH